MADSMNFNAFNQGNMDRLKADNEQAVENLLNNLTTADDEGKGTSLFSSGGTTPAGQDPAASVGNVPKTGSPGRAKPMRKSNSHNKKRTASDTEIDKVISEMKEKASAKMKYMISLFDEGTKSKYYKNYESQSQADIALMNYLSVWCHGDESLMEGVFSKSALGQRDKWKNYPEYHDYTIQAALLIRLDGITPQTAESMNWPGYTWKTYSNGKRFKALLGFSLENLIYMLNDRMKITVRLNLITHKKEYTGEDGRPYQYKNSAGLKTTLGKEQGDESDIAERTLYNAAKALGWNVTAKEFPTLLNMAAMNNAYNPVCDMLTLAEKKYKAYRDKGGTEDFFSKFCDMHELQKNCLDKKPLFKTFLRLSLMWMAKTAFNDSYHPYEIPYSLVFVGDTNIGKSHWLKALVPHNGADWIKTDYNGDLTDKDVLRYVTNVWLCELAEGKGTTQGGKNLDFLKSLFSRPDLEYRRAYHEEDIVKPRRTFILVTANDKDLFTDEAMARRFLVYPIQAFHFPFTDYNFLKPNKEWENFLFMLWGQIMTMIHEGTPDRLTKEEQEEQKKLNQNYEALSSLERVLIEHINPELPMAAWTTTTSEKILSDYGFSKAYMNQLNVIITKWVKRGWAKTWKSNGKRWKKIPFIINTTVPATTKEAEPKEAESKDNDPMVWKIDFSKEFPQ